MKRIVLAFAIASAGCSNSTPTTPTPPVVVITQPPAVVVTPPVVTPPVIAPPVVFTPAPNPLLSDPRFSLSFYRQFAQGVIESGGTIYPLVRWQRAPKIYLQTIDERSAPVDSRLLDQTATAIINTAGQWTGGSFGVEGIERGTDTKENQAGWITVRWRTSGVCGDSTHGIEGGTITMNWRRSECTCGPLVAKHELGHALGYWHTDSNNDLMAATFQVVCDKPLSDREKFHARVAYSQAIGSLDPR